MITSILAGLVFLITPAAFGGQPLEAIKHPIEESLTILKDPQYLDKEKRDIQREKVWEIIRQVFDFEAISMRAVAMQWRDFSDQQKRAFTEVFTELLRNTYLDKIQGELQDEQVIFSGEEIETDKAVVKTRVLSGKTEIPMDYSLYLNGNKWLIYDVKIEGVSLVKNYRSQFKDFLSKEGPDQLIQKLKEKNEQHAHERNMAK